MEESNERCCIFQKSDLSFSKSIQKKYRTGFYIVRKEAMSNTSKNKATSLKIPHARLEKIKTFRRQ